mgnify:CR=1 FL=1
MPKKKKPMQWEVKKTESGKWGIFLMQEFCKTDEPVCYSASINKRTAEFSAKRLNEDSIANFGREE